MRRFKKTVSVLLSMVLCFAFVALPAQAAIADEEIAVPFYTYTSSANVSFTITSAGKATVGIQCIGISGKVSKIQAKTSIQKKSGTSWSRIDIGTSDNFWYNTANTYYLNASRTKTISASGTYRARVVFTVTGTDGNTEKITKYSSQVTY